MKYDALNTAQSEVHFIMFPLYKYNSNTLTLTWNVIH
jgi:hypothetical protein